MVSPAQRREAVQEAQTTLEVSERRACQVIRQPRSTQRYAAKERDGENPLVRKMLELVRSHPRYGYSHDRRCGGLQVVFQWRLRRNWLPQINRLLFGYWARENDDADPEP